MNHFIIESLIVFTELYKHAPSVMILLYFLVIFSLGVGFTLHDKMSAMKRKGRVPEKTLFIVAVLGGSIPMYVTMLTVSHKTKHKRFMIGLPCIIILQIAVAVAVAVVS